jgi:hypothetical protein
MGLFARKAASSSTSSRDGTKPKKAKSFRIELGWRGLLSLILVCFCLFFWMFVLGIWAGQTILFPQKKETVHSSASPRGGSVQKIPPARIATQKRPAG